MLHHVPTRSLQDQMLAEAARVLHPAGWFAGSGSRWGPLFAIAHLRDTMVLVDPSGFAQRLNGAGFRDAVVDRHRDAFRFKAMR